MRGAIIYVTIVLHSKSKQTVSLQSIADTTSCEVGWLKTRIHYTYKYLYWNMQRRNTVMLYVFIGPMVSNYMMWMVTCITVFGQPFVLARSMDMKLLFYKHLFLSVHRKCNFLSCHYKHGAISIQWEFINAKYACKDVNAMQ